MKNPLPKISIVTPSLNQGKYLEKTILSVLDQGYPNLEYLIIDGGSIDNSVEIIKKYAKHLNYWVTEPDRGQSHAINKGFERATGDIMGWLNSDDYYTPNALKTVVETFLSNPQAGAMVGAGQMVNGAGNVLLQESFDVTVASLYNFINKFFMQPSCFFTKEAWQSCGPLTEEIHLSMDLDLWLRITKKYSFAKTDAMLSTSLIHPEAKTTAFAAASIVDAAIVIMRHGGEKAAREKLEAFVKDTYSLRQLLSMKEQAINSLTAEHARQLTVKEQAINSLTAEHARQLADRNQRIQDLLNSHSWKITSPLRKIFSIFR